MQKDILQTRGQIDILESGPLDAFPAKAMAAFPALLLLRVPGKLHSTAFAALRHLASAPPRQATFFVRHFDFQQRLQRRASATMTMNGPEAEVQPQAKIQKLDDSTNGNHADVGAAALMLTSLRVKKLSQHAVLPSRGSALAAGYDLSSAYDSVVPARGKALVKTDLSVAVPEGTYGRIAPRSGLAWKNSIDVGAGVIDADYRGPLGVILFNHSDEEFHIKAGDRIAQFILEKIETPPVLEVDNLDATVRGGGGFGSTGVSVTVVA